jgi:hypothetical protein
MSLTLLQNVNFGRNRANLTGSTGVGYVVLDVAGAVISPRTTVGVYQIASGVYAANVTYPDRFNGQILWDCPATASLSASFATEEQNVEANDPRVSDTWQMVNTITGSIQFLRDMTAGRWKIDPGTNIMSFYAEDNTTLVAQFDLFDDLGNPSSDAVFERVKLP